MAYADYNDLIAFFDENTVNELLTDNGVDAEEPSSDQRLATIMGAASGHIEGACEVANLYTAVELAAVTGNSLCLLKELTCKLVMVTLVRRRPEKFGSEYWQAILQECEDYLDKLRGGQRLFSDVLNRKAKAGLPTVDGPTAVECQNLNLIPSRTRNFFPNAGQRLPLGRA